jgi:hypothetical protein
MTKTAKILITALVFSATVILTQESLAAGFKQGNDFQVQRITGNLTIFCSGQTQPGQNIKHVRCDADLWSPGLTDYFVGPVMDADQVTLNSTRADGSTKSKDSKYDGSVGHSEKAFNLGISTLTQKPLLKGGDNNIHYTLSKNGDTVSEGDFKATVTRIPGATCPSDSDTAFGSQCDYPQNFCDRYFDRHNNCQ